MSQEQETAMYDQPALFDERGEATVEAELEGMRIAPKGKSLRDIGRDRVQETMRREMTRTKQIEAELLNKQIPEAAQAIIDEYLLQLDRATWVIVQKMVEDGIRAGLALRTLR
jgi:hypothetical protein